MNFDWLRQRIGKGGDLDAVLRESARELASGFNADRVTIYKVSEDGQHLAGVVQMGLESFDAVKVRIAAGRSIAGHVAATRKPINIGNTFDEKELAPLEMRMKMFRAVDERTGYETRQVLAAPIVSLTSGKVFGVVEFLNRLDRKAFPKSCEEDIETLCALLAKAFSKAAAPA